MTCFSCLLVKSFHINFCYYLRISKLVILFTINTFLPFFFFIILRSTQVCLEGVVVEDNIIQTSNNIPHYTLHITHYTDYYWSAACGLWSTWTSLSLPERGKLPAVLLLLLVTRETSRRRHVPSEPDEIVIFFTRLKVALCLKEIKQCTIYNVIIFSFQRKIYLLLKRTFFFVSLKFLFTVARTILWQQ